MAPEVPEVEDDEILYRRIPTQPSYTIQRSLRGPRHSRSNRFNETKTVSPRARFRSPEEVAQNPRGKKYYVAVLRVSALRARGIEEMKVLLAQELTEEILGPF